MSEAITITIAMYDRSRRASVTLPSEVTVGELSTQCCERWKLPRAGFVMRHVGSNELLVEEETMWASGVREGSELQIFPIVEGGAGAAFTNPVRERRLLIDLAAAKAACRASRERIVLDEALGDPPTAYHFRFRCLSVARLDGDVPVYAEEHRAYVRLPPLYPAQPPTVQMLTPLLHPHVWPNGTVCAGAWRPTETLDCLLQRIGDLLTYAPAALNWRNVADDRAAEWAKRNQDMFPLDQSLFTSIPTQMIEMYGLL